jgi:hypothetical protein
LQQNRTNETTDEHRLTQILKLLFIRKPGRQEGENPLKNIYGFMASL